MKDSEDGDDEGKFEIGGLNNIGYMIDHVYEDESTKDEESEYHQYMDAVTQKYIAIEAAQEAYDPISIQPKDEGVVDADDEEDVGDVDDANNQEALTLNEHMEDKRESGCDDQKQEAGYVSLRPGRREMRAKPGQYTRREYGFHVTPERAIEELGAPARESIIKEIKQLLDRKCWHPVHIQDLMVEEKRRIIPNKLFVKPKYKPSGVFDKLKSRLVAGGGHRQEKVYSQKTSSPTVSTTCLFIVE